MKLTGNVSVAPATTVRSVPALTVGATFVAVTVTVSVVHAGGAAVSQTSTVNVVAPSSANLRVYRYQVPVVSRVPGRVIEVAVEEGNRPVKTGDVLFRVDPVPFENTLRQLKAQLVASEGEAKRLREQLRSAVSNVTAVRSKLDLSTSSSPAPTWKSSPNRS